MSKDTNARTKYLHDDFVGLMRAGEVNAKTRERASSSIGAAPANLTAIVDDNPYGSEMESTTGLTARGSSKSDENCYVPSPPTGFKVCFPLPSSSSSPMI